MSSRFEKLFDYILKVEGGYSDDKHDKGGKTRYGIIESEARRHGYKGKMSELPLSMAKDIYKKDYYDKNRLEELKDDRVALSILDWAVNSGTTGIKKAQSTANDLGAFLNIDGVVGSKTIEAINKITPEKFLVLYHTKQRRFYESLAERKPTQRVFLKGWINRVARKEKYIKENL